MGWARNATSGGKSVILTTGSGTTLSIPPGLTAMYICDGSNVFTPTVYLFAGSGNFTSISNSGALSNSGTGMFGGGITVTAGGVNIVGGGFNVSAGTVTFTPLINAGNGISVSGGINVNSGGVNVAAGGLNVSSGAVTVSPAATFYATSSFQGSTAGGATGAYIYGAGGTLTPTGWSTNVGIAVAASVSAAGFFAVSDRRAPKTLIADIPAEAAIEWIKRGRPRTFLLDGTPSSGFIAQEELLNERYGAISVHDDDRPEYAVGDGPGTAGKRLSRNYLYDIAFLTRALQDALARIEALEAAAEGR